MDARLLVPADPIESSANMRAIESLCAGIIASACLVSAGPILPRQGTTGSAVTASSTTVSPSSDQTASIPTSITPTVLTVLLPEVPATYTPPPGYDEIKPYVPYEGSAYTQGGDNTTILAFYRQTVPVTYTQVGASSTYTLTYTLSILIAGMLPCSGDTQG